MKDKPTSIPHDEFVRATLLKPDMAESFLQVHLPVELKSKCDLSNIQIKPIFDGIKQEILHLNLKNSTEFLG